MRSFFRPRCLALVLLAAPDAFGQAIDQLDASSLALESSRSEKGAERIVMRTGYLELGAEMALVTSEPFYTPQALDFTDLGLFRAHVRRSFTDWLSLAAATTLLAKQPTDSDEPVWQGAALGAQAELAPGLAAALGAGMGPLLGGNGYFYETGPMLLYKPAVGRHLRFLLGLGNTWTILDYGGQTQPFWLGELTSQAEIQVGDEKAAFWTGLDYDVPFASNPDPGAPDPRRGYLDPQVRLSVEIGGTLSLRSDGWSVFAAYRFVDRGEIENPATTLPILDGGFDQQQTMIGVEYRFLPKPPPTHDEWGRPL